MAAADGLLVVLLRGIYTEFVQQIIQAVPLSGRLLVRSFIVGQLPTVGS